MKTLTLNVKNGSDYQLLVQLVRRLGMNLSETKEETVFEKKQKKFNPQKYEGILSHLNLNIEKELLNMKKSWKRNT